MYDIYDIYDIYDMFRLRAALPEVVVSLFSVSMKRRTTSCSPRATLLSTQTATPSKASQQRRRLKEIRSFLKRKTLSPKRCTFTME